MKFSNFRYCLIDMLPMRYINHFQLLSSAIFMLLQKRISQEHISLAENRLKQFADEFEDFYGAHNVTLNLHLLRHIANGVRHNGPLWAQSTFSFETNNGILVRSNHATNNFLMELSWKYSVKKTLENEASEKNTLLGGKKTIRIGLEEKSILSKFGFDSRSDILTIYTFFSIRDIKFTSLKSKQISTIDYFVELQTGEIGLINYYLYVDDAAYALIHLCSFVKSNDHFKEITSMHTKTIVNVELIKRKLIYLKVGSYEVGVGQCNNYEKT